MPIIDDGSIPNETVLFRILLPGWTCGEEGTKRPQSLAFIDGQTGEPSLFMEEPGVLAAIRDKYPNYEIARATAGVVRAAGFAIERRPAESPEYINNPNSHVVIGLAATPESNKALTRMARKIATDENTTILPVSHPDHTGESV